MKNKNILMVGVAIILIGGVFYNIYSKKIEVIKIEDICEDTDCSNIPMPLNPPTSNTFTPTKPLIETTSSNPIQSGKIDEHLTVDNTLRDVNFCGEIYKVKQVFIDGVDVVQRVAELISTKESKDKKYMCGIASSLKRNGRLVSNEIGVPEVINNINLRSKTYQVELIESFGSPTNASHIGDFQINISTKDISIILQGFGGSSIEPIGKLK